MNNSVKENQNRDSQSGKVIKDSSSDAALSGRELDAAVAERVMGYTLAEWNDELYVFAVPQGSGGDAGKIKPYSSDIAAAMEVLDRFSLYHISRTDHPTFQDKPFEVTVYPVGRLHSSRRTGYPVSGRTLPEAICRAALQACASASALSRTVE